MSLEADRCELNLRQGSLLHKQAVVDSGRISGMRFGSRYGRADRKRARISRRRGWFNDDADLAARQWLDRLNEQFTLDMVKKFESVQRTEAFCANGRSNRPSWSRDCRNWTVATRIAKGDRSGASKSTAKRQGTRRTAERAVALQNEFAKFRPTSKNFPMCWIPSDGRSSRPADMTEIS